MGLGHHGGIVRLDRETKSMNTEVCETTNLLHPASFNSDVGLKGREPQRRKLVLADVDHCAEAAARVESIDGRVDTF